MNTSADAQIIELKPLTTNDPSVVLSSTLKTTDTQPQTSIKSTPPPPPTATTTTTTTCESTNVNTTNNKKVTIDLYPSKSPIALLQEYALKRLKKKCSL